MLENIAIILVNTTHPGNIGGVARAMKNMGLSDLRLVEPKLFPHEDAVARSSGATDLLDNASLLAAWLMPWRIASWRLVPVRVSVIFPGH